MPATELRSDPTALVESTLETFATALERGDAETAEGAIASAIEDGISPTTLHAEVIGPALRRLGVLAEAGDLSDETAHRAATIVRRVLATLYRYMTGGTEPNRERVLLAAVARRRAHARACRWSTTSSRRPASRRSSTPTCRANGSSRPSRAALPT